MPRRRGLDPDEVLSGRVKVTVAELLDLIHQVNPTGRDLAAREAAARYALKSRLQSFLVRRFGPELAVVPDPDHEGTVSILHRGQGRDGCHAVIDALDEDARAWVRLQIDLGPPSSEAPPAPPPPPPAPAHESIAPPSGEATPDSLVRRADVSLGSFDYDRARSQLVRAVTASGGAPGPSEALLTFLVETLGDDAEALAQEAALSPAALAEPDVRALLALAAARSGDEARALALLRGASEARSAGAFAALAGAALGAGDADRAAAHLEDARRRDPSHPSIADLTERIARAKDAARGAAEAEIRSLAAAGREADAEKKAAEVLSRWPESEAARRVMRAADERRRRVEVARLAAEAEAVLAAGDPERALAVLARAAGVAPAMEREGIERRAREIDAVARAHREAAQVDDVCRLLRASDPREGLAAYLDLADGLRAEVRAREGRDRLARLDLSRAPKPRSRIEAVLALEKAEERAAADPEEARDLIAPHLAVLERVPEARRIVRAVEARLAEARLARTREAVRAARAALAAGRAGEAQALVDDAAVRDLPEGERAEAEALRAEAGRRMERARREAEVGRLEHGGRLFEARDLAAALAAEAAPDAARWEGERRRLQAAIQRSFAVEVCREQAPFDTGRDPFPHHWFHNAVRWLTEDGRALVLAEGHGRRVVLTVVEREGLVVRAAVILRTPEPFGCAWYEVIGPVVWLSSEGGALLAIALDTWEVQSFRPWPERLPGGKLPYMPVLPSGMAGPSRSQPRFLWNAAPGPEGVADDIRVYDLAARRPPRVLPGISYLMPVLGHPEPRAASMLDDAVVLYEERGVPSPEGRLPVPGGEVITFTMRPDAQGLIAVVGQVKEGGKTAIAWVDVPFRGPPSAPHPILEDALSEAVFFAGASEEGIVVLSFQDTAARYELMALGPAHPRTPRAGGDPAPIVELWRVVYPNNRLLLVQDAAARRAAGFVVRPEGLLIFTLGRTPPEVSAWTYGGGAMVEVVGFTFCLRHNDAVQKVRKMADDQDIGKLTAALQKVLRRPQVNPLEILLAYFESEFFGAAGRPEQERAFGWLVAHTPDLPDVMLVRAERLARRGAWREVVDLLAPLAARTDTSLNFCPYHEHHLTALAFLRLGEPARAAEVLDRIGEVTTPCPFPVLRELLTPLPDPLPAEAWGPDRPFLVQLAGAARHADACFARGDPSAALAALSRETFATSMEVQILARLAEAWLRSPEPEDLRGRIHKATALGRFVEVHAVKEVGRREVPLPGALWDTARLDDVSTRAAAWLEARG